MDAKPNFTEGSSKNVTLALRTELFKHEPLDYSRASIRLLQIHADLSRAGLIQCSLTHTTISETPYSCLSYRWGEPLPSWKILINGRAHRVGGNLYDFLDTFRQSTRNQSTEYVWIDAICIAQDDVLERNHQVTQMGDIYSTARSVYVWLGKMPSIAPIVTSLKNWQNPTYEDISTVRSGLLSDYLFENEYWNRAWITQEFLLARHAVVFLDNEPMDFPDLLSSLKSFYLLADKFREIEPVVFPDLLSSMSSFHLLTGRSSTLSSFSQHVDLYQEPDVGAGLSLISLLGRFRGKRCSLQQDRVFSLLSLCSPSSRIAVDYNQDAVEMICEILARSPAPLCMCEIMTLLHDVGLLVRSAADTRHRVRDGDYVEVDLDGYQLPENLSSPALSLFGDFAPHGDICPTLEKTVMSCAAELLRGDLTLDQMLMGWKPMPALDIPFIFRKLTLDSARKLSTSASDSFSIYTITPGSRRYTVRISFRHLIGIQIDPSDHCTVTKRGARTHGAREGFRHMYAAFDELFQWQRLSPIDSHLAQRLSFETCNNMYKLLVNHRVIPPQWGQHHKEETYGHFLSDLARYMRGEATIIPATRLREAIEQGVGAEKPVASEALPIPGVGWGPCRFVRSKD